MRNLILLLALAGMTGCENDLPQYGSITTTVVNEIDSNVITSADTTAASCYRHLPKGVSIRYSYARHKYAAFYMDNDYRATPLYTTRSTYTFFRELGENVAVFDDSCAAKIAVAQSLDMLNNVTDFK